MNRTFGTALVAASLLVMGASVAPAARAAEQRTEVVYFRAMPVDQAEALYRKVVGLGPEGAIEAGPDGRSLVLRDTPGRLDRFRALVKVLDVPAAGKVRVFARPVIHRRASELLALVRDLVQPPDGVSLHMAADDRSRTLVVMTTLDFYEKMDRLLRRVDVPSRDGDRVIRIAPGELGSPAP